MDWCTLVKKQEKFPVSNKRQYAQVWGCWRGGLQCAGSGVKCCAEPVNTCIYSARRVYRYPDGWWWTLSVWFSFDEWSIL